MGVVSLGWSSPSGSGSTRTDTPSPDRRWPPRSCALRHPQAFHQTVLRRLKTAVPLVPWPAASAPRSRRCPAPPAPVQSASAAAAVSFFALLLAVSRLRRGLKQARLVGVEAERTPIPFQIAPQQTHVFLGRVVQYKTRVQPAGGIVDHGDQVDLLRRALPASRACWCPTAPTRHSGSAAAATRAPPPPGGGRPPQPRLHHPCPQRLLADRDLVLLGQVLAANVGPNPRYIASERIATARCSLGRSLRFDGSSSQPMDDRLVALPPQLHAAVAACAVR